MQSFAPSSARLSDSVRLIDTSSKLTELCRRDPKLASIRRRLGDPPAWKRPANFSTLVRIILEQQVSLASGKATFERLRAACNGTVNATRVIHLSDQQLRNCGLTRQKARYVGQLAKDVKARRFSVAGLAKLTDDEARTVITSRLGLGDWTADVYLMMALERDDVLPVGDLALVKGLEELDGETYATGKQTAELITRRAEIWHPFRSWGTRLIWASYLNRRQRPPSPRSEKQDLSI